LLPRFHNFGDGIGIRFEPGFFGPNLADRREHAIQRLFGNFFDHDLKGRQFFAKFALTGSWVTSLLA